jgi:hypothetical protein
VGCKLVAQDLSMNGIVLNGHKIRKASVILMDGDIMEIPASQSTSLQLVGHLLHAYPFENRV